MSTAFLSNDKKAIDEIPKVNEKFINLNLNNSYSSLKSVNELVSYGSLNSQHIKLSRTEDDQYNRKNETSFVKSTDLSVNLCDRDWYKNDEKNVKQQNKLNSNSSTLSLHIAAYENSIEITNQDKKPLDTVTKQSKVFLNSMSLPESFEIPRQQGESKNDPEIMQFKASQKLLNPNKLDPGKVYLDCKTLNDIFKSPCGARKSEWRKQMLQAAGFPQYIPSNKIFWSFLRVEKETASECKRLISSKYHTKYVLIGETEEWEKQFQAETIEDKIDTLKTEPANDNILEKLKHLEDELQKERETRIQKENENSILLKDLQAKNERIAELEYRLGYQQRRTCEILDRLNDKEKIETHLMEEIKRKDRECAEMSQKKDSDICKLMENMKIKDGLIENLQQDNLEKKQQIDEMTHSIEVTTKKLERVRDLNHKKSQKLNSKGVSSKSTGKKRVKEINAPIEKKKAKIDVMEDGKSYEFGLMLLCVQLSWLGIFDTKIVQALSLISNFLNIDINRIPNRTTIGRWCLEFSLLINAQLDKFFDGATDLTLHSDETTLSSDILQAYVFCKWENGVRKYFVAGLEHVPDKTAARSLKAIIACMKRTIKPFEELDDNCVAEILTERLGKIKNVVSDRASTQKKFNIDLWKKILSLIPGTPKLNAIFCHHHILASVWDVFVKSCLNDERQKFNNPLLNFSTLQTAIQFISSNYGDRSNAPAKAKEWHTWANQKGYKNTSFPSKYGSRWNVGPAICARLLFNRKKMLEFLNETKYINEDSHASLVKVLEYPAFVVQLQIGAWIDQIINGPWWTELDSDKHVIELNIESAKIIEYLDKVTEDATLFNNDEIFPMNTKRSAKQIAFRDAVLSESSEAFLDILPQFCSDLSTYLKAQLSSMLDDEFMNNEANREILASASCSNKVSEQVFGMATDIRHLSSSKSVGRIAANVAGVKNGTIAYINNLNAVEYEELKKSFKAARSRFRLQRIEEKKALDQELAEKYKKNQDKQRKKKIKKSEVNMDKYIGENFTEIWGQEGIIYNGQITQKTESGYAVYYPDYGHYDEYSFQELKDLVSVKKIIFPE